MRSHSQPFERGEIRDLGLSGIAVLPQRMIALKPENVSVLAESMATNGLLQPIVVRPADGIGFYLIAGRHRFEAARSLGWESIRCLILTGIAADKAMLVEIDENLCRADLSKAERALLTAKRKELYERENPETRHGAVGKHRPKSQSRQNGDSDERFTKDTATKTGKPERTIQRDAARGEAIGDSLTKIVGTSLDEGKELDALALLPESKREELIARAASGEKVSAKIEAKKIARQQREATLGARQQALPQKTFGVILADPEWKWRPWAETGMDRGVENTYPTTETTDIAARDVASIAADDCVLVLWARADMLPEALQVMAAWGFRYVAQRVWRKSRMSTGYWFRYDHELVLIGRRGNPVAPAMGTQERSVFEGEPAVAGLNSSKPECVAEWIEQNWPNTPKIELNRRGPARPGWSAWGNQAEDVPSIGEPAGLVPLISSGEGGPESDPGFSAGSPMGDQWSDLDIPEYLIRSPDAAECFDPSPEHASVTPAVETHESESPAALSSSSI